MSTQSRKVKAWTWTSPSYPDTLKLGTYDAPVKASNDTSILIEVKAAALNPVDVQLMNWPIFKLPRLNATKVPGWDVSGIVLAAGKETGFKQGDEIFGIRSPAGVKGTGAMAEVMEIDTAAASTTALEKPKEWSWIQAASLPLVWLTARTMIDRIEASMAKIAGLQKRAGKVVVLGGSSATGMYAVLQAKQRGYEVLSTCSGKNTDFVRSMGAAHVVDYTKENVPAKVRDFGPDAVLDCVGGTECIGIGPLYVTIVGDKTDRVGMGGPGAFFTHPRMVLRFILSTIGVVQQWRCIGFEARNEWLAEALKLKPEEIVIDSTVAFDKLKEGYEKLNTGRARGKIVLEVA